MNHGADHHLWRGEAATSTAIHRWLREHYPKRNLCEECGKHAKTHYAFLFHPRPHTRDRSDYRELCPACHSKFDARPLTHCRRGHELIPENVVTSKGRRWCKTCKRTAGREASRRYAEKRRAA